MFDVGFSEILLIMVISLVVLGPEKLPKLAADIGRTAVMATVAALLWTATPGVWVFAVLAALRGTGDALFSPALGGLRAELSASDRLPDANALLQVVESAAMVVGPALAGVLIVAISSAAVVAVERSGHHEVVYPLTFEGVFLPQS